MMHPQKKLSLLGISTSFAWVDLPGVSELCIQHSNNFWDWLLYHILFFVDRMYYKCDYGLLENFSIPSRYRKHTCFTIINMT